MCLSLCIENDRFQEPALSGAEGVPYLSLIHARAVLRPDAMPVPNRTWPALLPGPKR